MVIRHPIFLLSTLLLFIEVGTAATMPDPTTVEVNGTALEYVDIGEGEPVVFVHGAIADLRAWAEYAEPVSTAHRFIAYTRRFYGEQAWPDEPVYDFEQHAEDLAALMESLDTGPAHLVGWSSSGIILTYVAANYPELVKSIVVYEPVLSPELMEGYSQSEAYKVTDEDWGTRWGTVVEQLEAGDERHAVRKFAELVFEKESGEFDTMPNEQKQVFLTNARTIPIYFGWVTSTPTTCDYVSKIETPTLVLNGVETTKWFSMQAEQLVSCMQNATLELIPGAHHDGPIVAPDQLLPIVLGFIDANK